MSANQTHMRILATIAIILFSLHILFTHVFLPSADRVHMEYHDLYPIIAASRVLWEGGNPYESGVVADQIQTFKPGGLVASAYLYPPFWAQATMPLAALPIRLAQRVWLVLNVTFAALILFFGIRLFVPARERLYVWAYMLGIFSFFEPIYKTMSLGQVNLFVVLTIVLGVYFFIRKRPYIAGAVLAVGAMTKLWPLAVLYYFALRRRWDVLKASLLAFAIILLISLLLTPPHVHIDYFTRQLPDVLSKEGPQVTPTVHNVSLYGFLVRTLTSQVSDAQDRGMTIEPNAPHIASFDVDTMKVLVRILLLLTLVYVSWHTFRTSKKEYSADVVVLEASIYILILLIFSSFVPGHYLALLMLPFMALFASSRVRSIAGTYSVLVPLSIGAFFLTGVFLDGSYYALWSDVRGGSLFLQPTLYGLIALLYVLFMVVRMRKKEG